jgi:hypothetical protein
MEMYKWDPWWENDRPVIVGHTAIRRPMAACIAA